MLLEEFSGMATGLVVFCVVVCLITCAKRYGWVWEIYVRLCAVLVCDADLTERLKTLPGSVTK